MYLLVAQLIEIFADDMNLNSSATFQNVDSTRGVNLKYNWKSKNQKVYVYEIPLDENA